MTTHHTVDGMHLNVDRGPNWLFVKLRPKDGAREEVPQIAEKLWSISSRHFIYRLVLELQEVEWLPDGLMGELVLLRERLAQCGGSLRLCGLSDECVEALHKRHLESAFPNHTTREEAVLGSDTVSSLQKTYEKLLHSESVHDEDKFFEHGTLFV